MIAFIGAIIIAIGLIVDAWFNPPLPIVSAPFLGLMGIVFIQLAKQARLSEGVEIPESVVRNGAWIANVEAMLAVVCGLSAFGTLGMEISGVAKPIQQSAALATLSFFAVTVAVYRYTWTRFRALMRTAGAAALEA